MPFDTQSIYSHPPLFLHFLMKNIQKKGGMGKYQQGGVLVLQQHCIEGVLA